MASLKESQKIKLTTFQEIQNVGLPAILKFKSWQKSRSTLKITDTEMEFNSHEVYFECNRSLFPQFSTRSTDTKVMAFIHGHYLCSGNFWFKSGQGQRPLCNLCPGKLDTNIHQLLECPRFNSSNSCQNLYWNCWTILVKKKFNALGPWHK